MDITLADAGTPVLGQSDYPNVSTFPILYSITYLSDVPPRPFYSLSARITCSGVLRYYSDTAVQITVDETGVNVADIRVRALF